MRRRAGALGLGLLATLALTWVAPGPASACPGCQNPNLPMVRSGGVHLGGGQLKFGAVMAVQPIRVRHDAGCVDLSDCDAVPVQPAYVHDQFLLPMQLMGTLDWGITSALGLEVQLPVRAVLTRIDYETPSGKPWRPLDPDTHHRNETISGVGDPYLGLRTATTLANAWWLVARVGVSVPLGRTEPDPFAAGERGERHQHIQLGTGTFDPRVGLELARSFGAVQLAAYGQVQGALYANNHGFQAGALSITGVQGSFRLAPRWLLQGSLEWFRQGPERWGGEIQQDGVLGRHEVLAGLGTTFGFATGVQWTVLARLPVYRKILLGRTSERGELTSPASLLVGVLWNR